MDAVPTYAIRPSFLGVERSSADDAICVAGIPFDLGTSNRPGARFGPAAIRQASRMLVDGDDPASWAEMEALDLADIGDFRIAHGDIAGTLAKIEAQAAPLGHLVALGGDHTVTLPLLRALASRKGALGLLHFDGHVDTWPESFGLVWGHGSPFYHAIEEGLVDPRCRQGCDDRYRGRCSRKRAASRCRAHPRRARRRALISQLRYRRARPGLRAGNRNA